MQYVRSISGSVSKTWNSINPATLSGAIDVIVVEHDDGTLACSPFHVRFGKFSLLRPYEKKVEFQVNNVRQDYAMKLGEGGEAFFVFETMAAVPEALQTSPPVSPAASPAARPVSPLLDSTISDPEPLDLDGAAGRPNGTKPKRPPLVAPLMVPERRAQSDYASLSLSKSFPESTLTPQAPRQRADSARSSAAIISFSTEDVDSGRHNAGRARLNNQAERAATEPPSGLPASEHSASPPILPKQEALNRALALSKKLKSSNILSQVNDEGDLMLDMKGYKSTEEESLRAEVVARQILSEELQGNYDIGSLIGADEKGNMWIYSSEEAKAAAAGRASGAVFAGLAVHPTAMTSTDALSDPGYHSDDGQSHTSDDFIRRRERRESDSAVGLTTPPESPTTRLESSRNYAKTLRLTSDQLKSLNLKSGANPMSFSVNRATCTAYMYLWRDSSPIVISDIDGTITKSDALGHVLNMIGRDWTHLGVAKLYSDIVANGFNILYLTSRSVGQADTTRAYINGIVQEGYRLPKGPVIMSPDRTIAALRREIYLRKPEVFKMACLRDIMSLFGKRKSPFYAGFGNRLTDALSYRSVNIPSTRIFTINSNAEVSLDLLSLGGYKTGYTSMRETVDHFFPPTAMLLMEGGEEYTDFNFWRDKPLGVEELTDSESASEDDEGDVTLRRARSGRNEDEGSDDDVLSDGLGDSYLSRDSLDDSIGLGIRQSIEGDLEDLTRFRSEERVISTSGMTGDEGDEGEDLNDLDLVAAGAGLVSSGELQTHLEGLTKALDDDERAEKKIREEDRRILSS